MRRALLAALLPALLGSSPQEPSPIEIDVTQGNIDGQVAISFWPRSASVDGELLDPTGLTVHLVPSADRDQELIWPCGEWFQPPPGQYRFWLEGADRISPFSSMMTFRGGSFLDRGAASVSPVVPAGQVRLSPEFREEGETVLRLLSVDSHLGYGVPKREFSRRAPLEMAKRGVLVPGGSVLGALFDQQSKEYRALTRPIRVPAGGLTEILPQPPQIGTDLLAILERPRRLSEHPKQEVEIFLENPEGATRLPDVLIPTVARVFAVWYGLEERFVTLKASGSGSHLSGVEIPLRRGRVESFRGSLQSLPDLQVEVQLPQELNPEELTLAVRTLPEKKPLAIEGLLSKETTTSAREFRHRFEALPATALEVVLDAPPWVFFEQVDLSDGRDSEVRFEPTPILVSGRVYLGDEGHPARVGFRTNRGPRERETVETDEEGNYRVVLYRPGYYSTYVDLLGDEGRPPFTDYLLERIEASTTLDFHVPGNDYRVEVVDRLSGDPVEGAQVLGDNKYEDETGGRRTNQQPSVTDREGVALLQRLRPGDLNVEVTARGYFPLTKEVGEVPDGEAHRSIRIALEPRGALSRLQLELSDGTPAAGAEVQLRQGLDNSPPFWQGQSDAGGWIQPPKDGAGYLLARHPSAGASIRRWQPGDVHRWKLSESGGPLMVKVRHSFGDPVPWAGLAAWLDGTKVSGNSLAWLTGNHVAAANADGFWQAKNLPADTLQILAWDQKETRPALQGVYDTLAVTVPFPRKESIEVVAVE